MSMKIDMGYGGNGFKISIGVGKTFFANNIDEVRRAIDHYFGQKEEKHAGLNSKCPLCQQARN